MFFLLVGLIGIALIITIPNRKVDIESTIAHIHTSTHEAPSEMSESAGQAHFNDVHAFLRSDKVDKTSQVHIHGLGLDQAELDLLSAYTLVYHPASTISGITKLNHSTITERQNWILNGQVQGADVDNVFITTPDDQTHQAAFKDRTFSIRSIAPVAGSYLLPVSTVLSSMDTIHELLPINVLHEPTWQMLVLSSFPSFEINYLKNYWTSLGNGFAMRSKISKDKFRTSFINSSKTNLDVITRRTISKYDFIITDVPSWNLLSTQEQGNIKRSVRDDGLALLIRPTSTSSVLQNLQIPTWTEPQEIAWKTDSDDVLLAQYKLSTSWRSTIMQQHTLAKHRSSGLGHIGVIGIDETYKLILADKEQDYQNLWSAIFSNLYRDFSPKARIIKNPWTWAAEKITMSILSTHQINALPILNDSIETPFLNVPFLNGVAEITLWPKADYNSLDIQSESSLSNSRLTFYAHPKDTWPALRQAQLLEINQQAAGRSTAVSTQNFQEVNGFPLWWWYVLVLLGFGSLWFDERAFN